MKILINFYTEVLLIIAIKLYQQLESIYLTSKLSKKVKPFNKGSGLLSKFISEENKQRVLIKKNNFLITHRLKILSNKVKKIKEEYFPERIIHLKNLMKYKYFREKTTLKEIKDNYLVYEYVEKAETADKVKYDGGKLYGEIVKFVEFLKKKGYYSQEMFLHNILVTKKGIKFIDLEGIVKFNKKEHDTKELLREIKLEINYKNNRLYKYKDILMKGDFHAHSNYTDGRSSVEEMVKQAKKNGLKIIAITEHVRKKLSYDFKKLKKETRAAEKKHGIKVLCGCEAKVLNTKGEIDVDEEIYKQCDIVVGSVHSFKGSKKDYLQALKAMISSGRIDVWGHPLSHARKKDIDITEEEWIKLINQCKNKGVYMEFNIRYGLPGKEREKTTIREKCPFIESSDAHHTSDLRRMK